MAQLAGKFIKTLNKVEGEKNGRAWVREQFEIMTLDDSQKMLGFNVFGEDKVAMVESLSVGMTVIVEYYPESREFDERVYTNLNCVRLQVASDAAVAEG